MAQPELARAYKMPSNIGKKKPFKVSDFLFKVSDSLRKRFFRGVNVNDVTVYPSRAPVFTQGVLAGSVSVSCSQCRLCLWIVYS
jgi:predicted oxidoreductase